MDDVQAAINRMHILGTMSRYAHGIDTAQYELVGGCFTDDGVLRVPKSPELEGPSDICSKLSVAGKKRREVGGQIFQRHSLSLSRIEIDGGVASAETYFHVITELGLDHSGRYVDKIRKVGGKWLFQERQVFVEYIKLKSRFMSPQLAEVAIVDTAGQ